MHTLDHIVPITHPYVCGLTVPWNIRVVPRLVNAAKSNKWHPDQQELFLRERDPVQLSLLEGQS